LQSAILLLAASHYLAVDRSNQSDTDMNEASRPLTRQTVYPVLFTIALTHFLNDLLQSVIPSVYPMMKSAFHLSFTQVGMITFMFQLMASLLQPFVGSYTDRKPLPYSLPLGMCFSLTGLLMLSRANGFYSILLAVSCVGIGSSIFHPESSRVAYLASGGKRGFAQSVFQLGGNAGSAAGPLMVALVVIPFGQGNIAYFTLIAAIGILLLYKIGGWYKGHLIRKETVNTIQPRHPLPKAKMVSAVIVLLLLIFSKFFYMASMSSYFTFYLIDKFHLSIQQSQLYLFGFLAAVAAGTLMGGPLGDRFGRKYIIWISILGAAPFTLLLPHANLMWTGILAIITGVILASAFSAILVYAQELIPGKIGTISGLFFGFAFGMGGIGSALLGRLADQRGIGYVFQLCAFLPLLGAITALLPNIEQPAGRQKTVV
jgi:FSR family fosmidomycin resistance protein-like MFS transporter